MALCPLYTRYIYVLHSNNIMLLTVVRIDRAQLFNSRHAKNDEKGKLFKLTDLFKAYSESIRGCDVWRENPITQKYQMHIVLSSMCLETENQKIKSYVRNVFLWFPLLAIAILWKDSFDFREKKNSPFPWSYRNKRMQ